ncbi:MAG: hypothetical protein HY021_17065 [Burkholderiales bacterium]|nr:hypothetical protein [Burkholderiales bacterium]
MPDPLPAALIARLVRARRAARAPEPADLGTAFGLDFRLDEQREGAAEARPDGSAGPTWLERWFPGRSGR